MRRRILVCALVVLAACGGGGDGASEEAFCAEAERLGGLDEEVTADELQAIVSLAPDEIRNDLDKIFEAIERFEELSESGDEDALGAAFEVVLDPEFEAAAAAVEEYLEETCGIETTSTSDVEIGADPFPDECGDPLVEADDGFAVMGVPTAALDRWLDCDATFADEVGGRTFSGGDGGEVGVDLEDGTVDRALAVCAEVSAFLADHPDADGSASVFVDGFSFGDDGFAGDRTPLVRNPAVSSGDPGACAPA